MELQFDIGGTGSPSEVIITRDVPVGKSAPFTKTIGMPILCLSANTLANGIAIYAAVDTGSVTVAKPAVTVVRVHSGDI